MPRVDPFYRRVTRLLRDDPRRAVIEVTVMFWLLAVGTLAVAVLGIADVLRIAVRDVAGFAIAGVGSIYLAVRGTLRVLAWEDDDARPSDPSSQPNTQR